MSTSSQAGIPANRSPKPGKGKAKKTRATSGPTSSTPFAQYDPATHSWKTCEATLLSDSETFSPTLPPAGILRNGRLFQRPRLAHHIAGIASSSWPTPTASDHIERKSTQQKEGSRHSLTLPDAVKRWPTPRSSAAMNEDISKIQERLQNGAPYKAKLEESVAIRETWPTPCVGNGGSGHWHKIEKKYLEGKITHEEKMALQSGRGGKLNPTWVEWLMGFPLGWTDLGDSETPSSRKSRKSSED
jgi:hypothetical protein